MTILRIRMCYPVRRAYPHILGALWCVRSAGSRFLYAAVLYFLESVIRLSIISAGIDIAMAAVRATMVGIIELEKIHNV